MKTMKLSLELALMILYPLFVLLVVAFTLL
jgi:hypothetical protein